jgi:hypothetical protein
VQQRGQLIEGRRLGEVRVKTGGERLLTTSLDSTPRPTLAVFGAR